MACHGDFCGFVGFLYLLVKLCVCLGVSGSGCTKEFSLSLLGVEVCFKKLNINEVMVNARRNDRIKPKQLGKIVDFLRAWPK